MRWRKRSFVAMGTTIGASPTGAKANRGYWAFVGLFGLLSIIRGVDRVGDGHPLSGWLLLVSGTVLTLVFVRMLWRLRSRQRPGSER
jgi:hypothetical protein